MQNQSHTAFVGHYEEAVEAFFLLEDFSARFRTLAKDVTDCAGSDNSNLTSQLWRRTIIRNIFVLIEASSYGLKRMALLAGPGRNVEFSPAELTILREEKHTLDEKGKARLSSDNFQKFIPNLKFAFNCFAKACGSSFQLDMSKAQLKAFEHVRNRLTHPKQLSELTLTDEELKTANSVCNWYCAELSRLMIDDRTATMKGRLSVQMWPAKPTIRVPISKDYVVMQPNGDVYQFDTLEEAEEYRRCQIAKDSTAISPLLLDRNDK
jgi:hypothetical protein